MTINSKKLLFIVTAMLVGIAFLSSCSKQSEVKTGKKGETAPAGSKAAKAAVIIPTGKSSLSAVRNGQYVTLSWQADLSGVTIKKIDITRSSTGKINNRNGVATLESGATSFKDCLPDENACWYWVRFVTTDGRFQDLGPVRVDIDKAGSSHYIKLSDTYKISIIRTDNQAVLKWDFPEDSYAGIRVVRAVRPIPAPFKPTAKAKPVVTTMERKSQYTDALPNPNSDYWYWFRITLKTGVIIDQGPIKAEYAGR